MKFAGGIDPGAQGAVAVVAAGLEEAYVWDWPGDAVGVGELMRSIIAEHGPVLWALEHVHAMPKQGVASMFAFGRNVGTWEGVLGALGQKWVLVGPHTWQKILGPGEKGTAKARSLAEARRLFTGVELGRKKDNGRADALHLARWALKEVGR